MASTAIAVQTERTPRMSIFDLSRTPEFSHLSVKMAKFVLAYVQGVVDTGVADPCAAVKYAYNCKNDESARTLGYGLLGNIKVILVLNLFFGVTPSEAFRKQVERAMYDKDVSVSQVDVLKLYSNINGFEKTAIGIATAKAVAKNHGHEVAESKPATVTAAQKVPADAISIWKNRDGEIIGYRDASGKNVQLLETK